MIADDAADTSPTPARGPLAGVKVIELGGIGPGPFAGMTLAEMGADVIRVDRPGGPGAFPGPVTEDLLNRGKRSVALDLKRPKAVEAVLDLVERADILIEGHRPGVAERLGLGPDDCHARNRRLVYGRITGWGQTGPLAQRAGHDIDYIAITGALHAIGAGGGPPQIPLNLVGDFGGGGTYLVMGVLAALWDRERTNEGRVVDAAIVDGAAHLLTATHAFLNAGSWRDERGVNPFDGGSPFYAVYAAADGRHLAVGAYESKFYAQLLAGLGLDDVDVSDQHNRDAWPETRRRIQEAFARRTQAQWTQHFADLDACVAPVVSLREAVDHPQIRARSTIVERDGRVAPAPAPRFSGGQTAATGSPPRVGEHTRTALAAWGIDPEPLLADGSAVAATSPDRPTE